MNTKSLSALLFSTVLFAISLVSHAQIFTSASEFVTALNEAKSDAGIQVGIVIDPHDLGELHYEIVSLSEETASAYDAIEKASIQKSYYPGYLPPDFMILGLNGVSAQKVAGKRRDWSFFFRKDKKWLLADTGIGRFSIKDGAILGLSLTSWSQQGSKYIPDLTPRMLNPTPRP
ncbi:hypothetical protein MRY82_02515 [bacterium]|nr:hypothetical protein [bacterium]